MASDGFDLASAVVFDNVAAGHEGILSDPTGSLIYKPCTPAEVSFYQTTAAEHPDFARLMPTFMGTLQRGPSRQLQDTLSTAPAAGTVSNPSLVLPTPELEKLATVKEPKDERLRGKELDTDLVIVLENVLAGFKKPSFMDIKLGKRLWADDAALPKRAKLDDVASKTTSGSLGFRIAGMQIWEPTNLQGSRTDQPEHSSLQEASEDGQGSYRSYDKFYGRGLTAENVKDAFDALLLKQSDKSTREYLEDIIRDIDSSIGEIEEILASKESRMYSASILLIFEGDAARRKDIVDAAVARALKEGENTGNSPGKDEDDDNEDDEDDEDDEEEEKRLFDVKMIDFAHAEWTPGQGPDENLLTGVRNVRKIIKALLK